MKLQHCLFPLLVAAVLGAPQAKNPDAALGAARHLEEAEGDYPAALEAYKKLLEQYGKDRALAARALVRMGQCYEKLGDAEARKAYERVLREFSDQVAPAASARERLAALTRASQSAPPGGVIHRLVWSTPTQAWGGVSPDGRWIAFKGDQGDLAIHDLTTGQIRLVTNYGPWEKRPGETSGGAFSPDGKRLAYMWLAYEPERAEIRAISVDGTGDRVLYRHEKASSAHPWAWTPDGTAVVASVIRTDMDESQILRISVADGSVQVLYEAKRARLRFMAFSPSGRFLAFTYRGIQVLDLESPSRTYTPVPLIKDSAHNELMSWSPDGNHILFVSDRSGARDAWLLPVKEGRPAGEPRLVKAGLARARDSGAFDDVVPMGLSKAGTFYYGFTQRQYDAMTVVLDSAPGRPMASPVRFTERFDGATIGPRWSPDGKWAFYQRGKALFLRNLESGAERELHPQVKDFFEPAWHPDGKSLVCMGWTAEDRLGVFRVDLDTGAATTMLFRREGWRTGSIALSRNGSMLYLAENKIQGDRQVLGEVVARDLRSGEEKVIHRTRESENEPYLRELALSPDGTRLAAQHGWKKIYVFPVTGDGPENKPIYQVRGGSHVLNTIAWLPDGKALLVCSNHGGSKGELGRIPVEAGQPETWPLPFASVGIDVHPDGRRIGLTAWGISQEVWALENFLPGK